MLTDYVVHNCLAKHAMLSCYREMYINTVTHLIIYSLILF
jgi:hypothetical protein